MAASIALRWRMSVQPRANSKAGAERTDEPGHVPIRGKIRHDEHSRHGNRHRGDRERSQKAPHQAAQELLQNQSPRGARNLLLKLVHDMLLRCGVGPAVRGRETRAQQCVTRAQQCGALALGLYGKQFCKSRFE